MKKFELFVPLLNFKQEILAEIIREAEVKLNGQMATATAADQRALSIAGFQIAAITALIGGVAALLLSKTPNTYMICVGFFQIGFFLFAAFKAIDSARPKLFSFAGNKPENWFHDRWNFEIKTPEDADIKQAMVEQCYCLNNAINDNHDTMETNARHIELSIDTMFWSIFSSGVLVAGYGVYRLLLAD
jgi:hypothetical protein